jgi:hypothetical protein
VSFDDAARRRRQLGGAAHLRLVIRPVISPAQPIRKSLADVRAAFAPTQCGKFARVNLQSLQCWKSPRMSWRVRVEDSDDSNLIAIGRQLPRHFEHDKSTQRVAGQMIRTLEMLAANLGDVLGRHRLDSRVRRTAAVHAARF